MNMTNISRRISQLWNKFKEYLRNLNFFPSIPPSTDDHELRIQRISTRLFIIIFSIALVILVLYNSLITVRKTVNVDAPSLTKYLNLYSIYSQTLTCPCSKISINYNEFLIVKYTLHQVCSSVFVDQSWINYLVSLVKASFFISSNFRHISPYSFQALRTFCELVNRTISDNRIRLYSNQYVSASVMSEQLLKSDTNASVVNFRLAMTNNFLVSRLMIRDITQANGLLSSVKTNYDIFENKIDNTIRTGTVNYFDANCSCHSSPMCTIPASIFHSVNTTKQFRVTSFFKGCYVIESLLKSSLECFYNQTCIDVLQDYLTSSKPMNVKALDASLQSLYYPNTTIQQIINNLMIEQWNVSILYERYYNECQPIQCTYIDETRNDMIYIVTILFGIAGGLTTILKLIVPRLIRLIMKKKEQQQQAAGERILRGTIRQLLAKLKCYLTTFNLFPSVPASTDEHELRTQRISTRLFIVLFVASMTIFLLYTSLIRVIKAVNVDAPSFQKYLELNSSYSQTLTCPCSVISINHNKFLTVNYTLHQVCSSVFVSQSWINYLSTILMTIEMYSYDFRRISQWTFQALRTVCELLNQTISDSLTQFNSNQYVSTAVIRQNQFDFETEILIEQFRLSMKNMFSLSLSMIRNTSQANGLFSILQTNYFILIAKNNDILPAEVLLNNGGYCGCASSLTCTETSSISDHDTNITFGVPGFHLGCYVIESLLQSTLECFYNQTCLDRIQIYMPSSSQINVTALDASLWSEYLSNSTIQKLIDNLMIEQWNSSAIYEQYYNACQPIQCTYTFETRNDIIYIVTTLFGIAGGLTTVLKLILPRLIGRVMKKKQLVVTGTNNERRTIILWKKSKYYFRNLNFFPSVPPSTDEHELRTQRISTRLFIFLLILLMTILLLYTSLTRVTQTVNVDTPSFQKYLELNSSYSPTLTCLCSVISINHNKFLTVNYTLHQICNSVFVNQSWIDYLGCSPERLLFTKDFRRTSQFVFQALNAFCDLINRTINESLTRFNSNQYVNAIVIRQNQFDLETKILINQFRLSIINSFSLSLSIIRSTTQANALFSALRTNYQPYIVNHTAYSMFVPQTYNNCSCASSSTCIQPSAVYQNITQRILFEVPGLYTGCYVIESLLQSTLECFYNQTCLDKIRKYIPSSSQMNVTVLDASLPSVYLPNSTIQKLIDNLMIEQWNSSAVYEQYYNACQPIKCTYTFETRNDIIYIVTTLFGIAGGLVTVLKFLVPQLINFIIYCIRKQRPTVAPVISIVQT